MTTNIHAYIIEPAEIKPFHISISNMQEMTNGTCDSIVFNDINYVEPESIIQVLNLLYQKLSYVGSLFFQFNHLEMIINDFNFNKIDELELNNIIFRGRRNLLNETTILSIIKNAGFNVKTILYDEYLMKMELTKNNG